MVQEPTMVQPVVQQFDAQQFEIHEDRSMTVAINTKKKVEIPDTSNLALVVPEDKENANQFMVPVAAPPQVFSDVQLKCGRLHIQLRVLKLKRIKFTNVFFMLFQL